MPNVISKHVFFKSQILKLICWNLNLFCKGLTFLFIKVLEIWCQMQFQNMFFFLKLISFCKGLTHFKPIFISVKVNFQNGNSIFLFIKVFLTRPSLSGPRSSNSVVCLFFILRHIFSSESLYLDLTSLTKALSLSPRSQGWSCLRLEARISFIL